MENVRIEIWARLLLMWPPHGHKIDDKLLRSLKACKSAQEIYHIYMANRKTLMENELNKWKVADLSIDRTSLKLVFVISFNVSAYL